MKPIDTGGPAFEFAKERVWVDTKGEIHPIPQSGEGMTWLDYAAIHIAAAIRSERTSPIHLSSEELSRWAYGDAQALLARKRKIEKGEA